MRHFYRFYLQSLLFLLLLSGCNTLTSPTRSSAPLRPTGQKYLLSSQRRQSLIDALKKQNPFLHPTGPESPIYQAYLK